MTTTPNRSDKEALMPDYYIAEDGTIHDREAEHRSRTQHTAAPAVADTTAAAPPRSQLCAPIRLLAFRAFRFRLCCCLRVS